MNGSEKWIFIRIFFIVSELIPFRAEPGTILTRRRSEERLTSADSGLQLDLEIALSGVPAKVQPHGLLQPGRRCVETSDDVIEDNFTTLPGSRIWDFSPIR